MRSLLCEATLGPLAPSMNLAVKVGFARPAVIGAAIDLQAAAAIVCRADLCPP
jgi:hypothetical protein